MIHDGRECPYRAPLSGAPTWVRALQAALIGVVAGLALHGLFALVVLHGDAPAPKPVPAECRKADPAREAGVPAGAPRASGLARGAERSS